jgi:hypothetical protein
MEGMMKVRLVRLALVPVVFAVAFLLYLFPVALASPLPTSAPGALTVTTGAGVDPIIHARRAISIPFGIATATLVDAGVEVSGHGHCSETGESYKVRVTVTQESTGARAHSQYASFACGDPWQVIARLQGRNRFEAGPVEVCAMAVETSRRQGNLVAQWCKELSLTLE